MGYPLGDLDAYKPSRQKDRIVFEERDGFIRLATQCSIQLVPVVSIGAHGGFYVLTDGAQFVAKFGLRRDTWIEVLPVGLWVPWGLGPQDIHLRL